MAKIRSTHRTGIFAALTLAICGISLASPAQAAATQCTGTLAQYGATIKQLETFSAKAQALADQNPLYISDVDADTGKPSCVAECARAWPPKRQT